MGGYSRLGLSSGTGLQQVNARVVASIATNLAVLVELIGVSPTTPSTDLADDGVAMWKLGEQEFCCLASL